MFRLEGAELEAYRRDGFGHVDELIDADALADLRAAYDRVLEADPDDGALLGGVTRQVMFPSAFDAAFRDNPAIDAAFEVARSILGTEDVGVLFDMLIAKPPGHPHETPWHQDQSYVAMPVAPAGLPMYGLTLQFWVAMDDADEENGCMHFLAGHHREPMLEHRVVPGSTTDSTRLLEIVGPEEQLDLGQAVPVPLAAGGCTFHNEGTPHYTPPNRSASRPRRAYIFNVGSAALASAARKG